MDSYFKYHRLLGDVAAKHGFTARVGAAIFAALSPNNTYFGNLRDAHKMMAAARAGQKLREFSVSTYDHNKRKAWEIIRGAEPLDLIVAFKTRSFFLNVSNPADPEPVTVDGHMVNIWRGKRENLVGLRSNLKLQHQVADGVRALARDYGCLPSQMQSILWITHRHIHGIMTTGQREFWDADYLAARLGFHPSTAV